MAALDFILLISVYAHRTVQKELKQPQPNMNDCALIDYFAVIFDIKGE
ncbi:hypothetical protein [Methanimicrococcus stummii]|nr:hypothetical protein [Methanimicrococcus sp. Es2]